MIIDSNELIRILPAMLQGRKKFAKMADGGNYHIGKVDDRYDLLPPCERDKAESEE